MKKLTKVLALVLVLATLALTLVSCSTYGNVKKAFEKEGYTESEDVEKFAKSYKEKAEKENLAVQLHVFTKGAEKLTNILDFSKVDAVLVYEFNASDDLKKAMEEKESIKGLVNDILKDENVNDAYNTLVEMGYVNGNCLVISLNPLNVNKVRDIVKKA